MTYLLLAALLAFLYLLRFCYAPASWTKTAVKTLSVLGLAAVAMAAAAPAALIIALVLCSLGDFLLSRDTDTTFLGGVAAFAFGHLAYVALFLTTPAAEIAALKTPLALLYIAVLTIYAGVMMRALYLNAGDLRIAVMGYVLIILSMGIAAFCVPQAGLLALVLPAALLFMMSDSVLAADYFLLRPDHPLRRATPFLIWSTYWVAQLGFTLAYTA